MAYRIDAAGAWAYRRAAVTSLSFAIPVSSSTYAGVYVATHFSSSSRNKSQSRVSVKCPECDNVFLPSIEEKQSRAGASSRRKGANFERTIAKKLKTWWPRNYDFRRTPMSGGSVLKDGFDMAGDICTNAPDFKYHLELKNAPGSFKGLHNWFSNKSVLWKWMAQAVHDCPDNKIPLLIWALKELPPTPFCLLR